MKAITLTQPWASLVACGAKKIETRSWRTHHRGWIAIHAAKGWTGEDREFAASHREKRRQLEDEALKAELDRRLAEAAALEREATATGDTALQMEADALISEPVIAPVVILPTATPKVAGVSYREEWDFEVVDDAKIPREYLTRDDAKIRRVVKAMKGTTNIPGVRAFSRRVVAAGGGR